MSWNIDMPDTLYASGDSTHDQIQYLVNAVTAEKTIAIDTETTGLSKWGDVPLYWSLAWGNSRATLRADTLCHFQRAFADESKTWILANAKFDMHMLANYGFSIKGMWHDVQVMHALLHEDKPHKLKFIANHILGWTWADFQDQFGRIGKLQSAEDVIMRAERENFDLLVEYAANDAWGTLKCWEALKLQLEGEFTYSLFTNVPPYISTLWDFFSKVEVPYTKALWAMERRGIKVNRAQFEAARPEAKAKIRQVERDIVKAAGFMLNPKSTPQLQKYFFEIAGLTPLSMTKGGKTGVRKPQCDEKFLEHYKNDNEVAGLILEHREYTKLLGTYIDGLEEILDPYDRIHSNFNQDVARTGRLSCVAEWTPVHTARGHIPIKDVAVGDLVFTHKKRWRRVTRTVNKGPGLMYDVRFSNGEVLTCTTDHRLLTSEGWRSLGDILEHLEEVGLGPEQPHLSSGVVPFRRPADAGCDSREAGHDVPQRLPRREQVHGTGREEGAGKTALLAVQNWTQEPHEGEDRREPPQLERLVRRWVRVPDLSSQGQEDVRTPRRPDGSAGSGEVAKRLRDSSHRRGQEEQRTGQPGAGDTQRSQDHSLPTSEGFGVARIDEVITRGVYKVLDLTVEEDASYAACGVFSHNSSDPNLQNIPRPENDHWNLRSAFITEPGWRIIAADYSQLEMRLLAAAALEEPMIDIFRRGWDIHCGNASLMYDTPYEDIHCGNELKKKLSLPGAELQQLAIEMSPGIMTRCGSDLTQYLKDCARFRSDAKNIGFGLNYGMGPGKLARDLGVERDIAIAKIDQYKKTYPAVERFMKEAIEEGRKYGYAFTVMGRRRNIPMITSNRKDQQALGERLAVNTQIQGSAADVCRMAQLNLVSYGLDRLYDCHIVLQVHDELVFEVPEQHVNDAKADIEEIMTYPFPIELACPLEAEAGVGLSWGEAK